jgi:hypothetical protein
LAWVRGLKVDDPRIIEEVEEIIQSLEEEKAIANPGYLQMIREISHSKSLRWRSLIGLYIQIGQQFTGKLFYSLKPVSTLSDKKVRHECYQLLFPSHLPCSRDSRHRSRPSRHGCLRNRQNRRILHLSPSLNRTTRPSSLTHIWWIRTRHNDDYRRHHR